MPPGCRRALDAGCGEGDFARLLAERCDDVVALDADPAVLALAASRGRPGNVAFVEGDLLTCDLGEEGFDFVGAIASLHHLPLRPGLARLRSLLRPGGVLAILGLHRLASPADLALAAVSWPTSRVLRWRHGFTEGHARLREPLETLEEIRQASDEIVPGARIRRHLLFRYSLIWRKPCRA